MSEVFAAAPIAEIVDGIAERGALSRLLWCVSGYVGAVEIGGFAEVGRR